MTKQEHLINTEILQISPPLEIQFPTDEQIEAINNPGHLPDFLNHGLLRGLALAVKSQARQVDGLEQEALLIGDPGYVENPHRHKALMATLAPGPKPDNEQLTISSNLEPGLFLHLSFNEQYQLDNGRAVYATHTGISEGWYSKMGSGPSLGHPRIVGRVIESALPTLLARFKDIEEAA